MIKRLITAVLLTACAAWAQSDEEWASGIGQKDQVTKGLVSYWSMRNSGTTVFDEIGDNNGVATNSPTINYAGGVVGVGCDVNGTNQYIYVPHATELAPVDEISIVTWARPRVFSDRAMVIDKEGDPAANKCGYAIRIQLDGVVHGFLQTADGVGGIRNLYSTSIGTGSWTQIAMTYSGSLASLYINGAAATSVVTSGSMRTNTLPLNFGRRGLAADRYFNGAIDEVRIYNRAIASDEVKKLYRMGKVVYQNR